MDSRVIQLTAAAYKHGNLNISSCGKGFFPSDVYGGPSRSDRVGIPIKLKVAGLNRVIETDIPVDREKNRPRGFFRERKWVKQFVRANKLAPSEMILITKEGNRTYTIGPVRVQYRQDTLFADDISTLAKNAHDSMNSPFRYAGGKFYARKLILEHIPPHTSYCEPFAGGASIFFAKPKVARSYLNDLDEDLMTVYRILRDRPEDLITFLHGIPATKEMHAYFKNEFHPKNILEKGARWYYLNRTSYSGIMNMQNCYWGYGDKFSMRPENWPKSILQASAKLQGVKLTNCTFEKAIETVEDGTFLFVDPPYFNADQDKFYRCAFSKEDHYRLEKILYQHRKRVKILLTYDDFSEIRKLYSWAVGIYNKEWNYCINRTDDQKNGTCRKGQRYKGKELFILNYKS